MLSRVANSLFWMSRYVERAENVARILDVNLQLLLDFRNLDDQRLAEHWVPIIKSTGDDALFFQLYKEVRGQTVTEFLTFQNGNPNSIISCIAQARENARMVRDQISGEMWEEINRLHLFLRSPQAREVWNSTPYDFYQEIKTSSLYLRGLTDATIRQNEHWHFIQLGKYLERADKTTRILDVRSHTFSPEGALKSQTASLEWAAILRSCSAWDAYRQIHSADVDPTRVAEFLLLSDEFPRSVRFCLTELDAALRRVSGVAPRHFSNEAEKLSGRLLSEVQFNTIQEILKQGLHDYLDQLQQRFNQIGEALFAVYIFQPFNDLSYDILQQQQQQQQQTRLSSLDLKPAPLVLDPLQ
jgi:uncharacterized alpha-E superfamily protein